MKLTPKIILLGAFFLLSCSNVEYELEWSQVGGVSLSGDALEMQVQTGHVCCGNSDTEQGGTPIKVYAAPYRKGPRTRPEAVSIYLGHDDVLVVSKETTRGHFGEEIYRSEQPVTRDNDWVTIRVPSTALPDRDFRLWLGRGDQAKLGDVVLRRKKSRRIDLDPYPFVLVKRN